MNLEDTYRPADMPPDAVMMPATEVPDAPLPVAQNDPPMSPDDPAMQPAKRPRASLELERLRSRVRTPENALWYDALQSPIDSVSPLERPSSSYSVEPEALQSPQHGTITQGAALSTLVRSAARQYSPTPTLAQPYGPGEASAAFSQPQMRGALRQVVRNAQGGGMRPGTGR